MDDLVELKKANTVIRGYFDGTDRKNGAINIEAHDRSSIYRTGVKTQDSITKYQVDPLGNITEIKSEKRLSLKGTKNKKG